MRLSNSGARLTYAPPTARIARRRAPTVSRQEIHTRCPCATARNPGPAQEETAHADTSACSENANSPARDRTRAWDGVANERRARVRVSAWTCKQFR